MAQIGLLLNLNGRQMGDRFTDSSVVDGRREGLGSLIVNKLWLFGLNLDGRYRIRATAMRWLQVAF